MGDGVKSTSDRLHCYAYSTIKAPDKGEVGGSSPPRPTIQITNIYEAILTFPFLGTFHQKTVLPKIFQKFEEAIDPVIRGLPMCDSHETSKVGYGNLVNLFD